MPNPFPAFETKPPHPNPPRAAPPRLQTGVRVPRPQNPSPLRELPALPSPDPGQPRRLRALVVRAARARSRGETHGPRERLHLVHRHALPTARFAEGASRARVSPRGRSSARRQTPRSTLSTFLLALLERRGAVDEHLLAAFLDAGFTHAQAFETVLGVATYTLTTFANRVDREQ